MALRPKDKAPDFELLDQDGKKVSLSGVLGRKVLLFFYPKAGTWGLVRTAQPLKKNLLKKIV